jgi:ElaA protein
MARMPEIETEWQRLETVTTGQLYQLLRFRQSIFVVEQRSPYPDLDDLDQSAWHLLGRVNDELVGCLRLMPIPGPPAIIRIGRVAVAADLRRRGIGHLMMKEALAFCRSRYPRQPIALGAQLPLVRFYKSFGFVTVSDAYDDFGVEHVEMTLTPAG